MTNRIPAKTMRKMLAAEGYLELGMAQRALRELGESEANREAPEYLAYLQGEALRLIGQIDIAVRLLERAAREIPRPFNRRIWLALSDCYRQRGDEHLAKFAMSLAKSPVPVLKIIPPSKTLRPRSSQGSDSATSPFDDPQ